MVTPNIIKQIVTEAFRNNNTILKMWESKAFVGRLKIIMGRNY